MKNDAPTYAQRGLRNANPCNIRRTLDQWRGMRPDQTDASFVQFVDFAHGFRAFFVLMTTYAYSYHLSIIDDIIRRYAPPTENATYAYCKKVHELLGSQDARVAPPIDEAHAPWWCSFALAVASVENGVAAIAFNALVLGVCDGWKLFARGCGISTRHAPTPISLRSLT